MLPFNETWGYAHNAMTASDTGIVCDWTASGGASAEGGATSALGGRPTCVVAECEGHRENDVLPFANLSVPRGSDGDVGSYTNRRLYALQLAALKRWPERSLCQVFVSEVYC